MEKNSQKPESKDLAYYLTLYRLEGHSTWRAILSQNIKGFNIQAQTNNWPKITEVQTLRIDRATGTFSEYKDAK